MDEPRRTVTRLPVPGDPARRTVAGAIVVTPEVVAPRPPGDVSGVGVACHAAPIHRARSPAPAAPMTSHTMPALRRPPVRLRAGVAANDARRGRDRKAGAGAGSTGSPGPR